MSLLVAPQPNLEAVLAHFRALMQKDDSPIRAIRHQPARAAEYMAIPESVHPKLRAGLERRNIPKLYSHQGEAFEIVKSGRNVVIVTPTASGKTLCYNLPVLDLLLRDPESRAIYLYPTKALAEDQLHEFQTAVEEIGGDLRAFTYDGDTPQDARKAIRQRAGVVMTNPDMLHSGILPHHTKWAKLFENLRYIIIDELHYYRGVYGSHLANLLRRMRRICEFYGSSPQFICSSATIANPRELAESLTGAPFEMVDRNGAPSGEKYFLFYNPPVVNRQLGIRRSYINETCRIALEFIERDQQTLVFANNRLATEILVTYLKDAVGRTPWSAPGPPARLSARITEAGQGAGRGPGGPPHDTVRGYRGGYLPRERREIERKLRDGEIRAVVATNALELGIDIGSLDAVVMAGYPGTIASTWQRAGRAGRRQSTSAAVLVASSAPLDQYIVEHPDYFFDRPPEHAYINPDNLEILLGHLKCAAFELPLRDGEKFGQHDTTELCRFLAEAGFLHHSAGSWHWTSETYPADAISLRSVSSDNFVVVDITAEPAVIAEVSFPTALTTLHEKAIYLHEARQYHVERFDYQERKAYVRRVSCDYYTDAIDYTQVQVLQEFASDEIRSAAKRCHGEVRVNRQIVGFKKIKFYTNENVGAGTLSMPEQEMHTTAFWLHFPAVFLARLADLSSTDKQDGLTGLGAALRTVASLLLMCDPRDLGVALSEEIATGLQAFEPNLYLYDTYSGGIGQSAPLYQMTPKLLAHAAQLLDDCPCEAGCPSCVGPIGEIGERGKQAARRILAELLLAEAAIP
jgi:DEAD/DEAH box helicase domain-containing protein